MRPNAFNAESAARGIVAANAARRAAPKIAKADDRQWKNPATADPEYTAEEVEFLLAMDAYKRDRNRPFPAWSEVLGVLKSLGYAKPPRDDG